MQQIANKNLQGCNTGISSIQNCNKLQKVKIKINLKCNPVKIHFSLFCCHQIATNCKRPTTTATNCSHKIATNCKVRIYSIKPRTSALHIQRNYSNHRESTNCNKLQQTCRIGNLTLKQHKRNIGIIKVNKLQQIANDKNFFFRAIALSIPLI